MEGNTIKMPRRRDHARIISFQFLIFFYEIATKKHASGLRVEYSTWMIKDRFAQKTHV